jgi:hypothetical protein
MQGTIQQSLPKTDRNWHVVVFCKGKAITYPKVLLKGLEERMKQGTSFKIITYFIIVYYASLLFCDFDKT